PAVDVQAKDLHQIGIVDFKTIFNTTLAKHLQIHLVVLASKGLPGHLDIAVGGNLVITWCRRFRERDTECPATKYIPVLKTSAALERDRLIFCLLRELETFHHSTASVSAK